MDLIFLAPTADSAVYVDTTNNVLCTFIQYTSIIMQDTKGKEFAKKALYFGQDSDLMAYNFVYLLFLDV